jgi:diguanylate cyclase (GGDEF)-like protein
MRPGETRFFAFPAAIPAARETPMGRDPGAREKPVGWRNLLVFRPGAEATALWRSLLPSLLVVIVLTVAVVVLDRFTGRRPSVLPLYVVLVAWVAWRFGLVVGLLVAVVCSSEWFLLNTVATDAVGIWNGVARFAVFVLIAYLAALHHLVSSALAAAARFASTDILTGALSRRAFAEAANREMARCRRENAPLSVAYFDLDRFKDVNDVHGHAEGDALLAAVAQSCRDVLRATDVLVRVGGDEFVALLPCTGADDALRVVDRLRTAIEATTGARYEVTASIGLVTWHVMPVEADTLLERADREMYAAKRRGGNQIIQATFTLRGAAMVERPSHLLRAPERAR